MRPGFSRLGTSHLSDQTDTCFLIRDSPQLTTLDLDDGEGVRKSAVYARLVALGASDRLVRQWIAEHGETALGAKHARPINVPNDSAAFRMSWQGGRRRAGPQTVGCSCRG
jgi:hypothetical protein